MFHINNNTCDCGIIFDVLIMKNAHSCGLIYSEIYTYVYILSGFIIFQLLLYYTKALNFLQCPSFLNTEVNGNVT